MTLQEPTQTFLRWLPVSLWVGAILVVSSIPGQTLGDVGFQIPDKLAHAAEYAGLGLLALRQQAITPGVGRRRAWITALILGCAVGGFDEIYQSSVPQRTPSVFDWIADVLGTSLGVWLGCLRYRPGASPPTESTV